MPALETESEVIAVTGYAAVRQAFNDVLDLCVVKLTQADRRLAWEVLDLAGLDEDDTAAMEMLSDTALFSRRNPQRARRAIDRIAGKLPVKRDPLKSAIAARLPAAIFSIFRVIGRGCTRTGFAGSPAPHPYHGSCASPAGTGDRRSADSGSLRGPWPLVCRLRDHHSFAQK